MYAWTKTYYSAPETSYYYYYYIGSWRDVGAGEKCLYNYKIHKTG